MPRTRGNLEAATIYEVDENGNRRDGGHTVACMFNPYEYTVSKTNTFSEEPANDSNTPHAELSNSGAQTLRVKLTFDTYETGEDVTQETNKLWRFMMRTENASGSGNERSETPQVAFEWGVFKFVSYLTQMTQKFTLFKNDGTPVLFPKGVLISYLTYGEPAIVTAHQCYSPRATETGFFGEANQTFGLTAQECGQGLQCLLSPVHVNSKSRLSGIGLTRSRWPRQDISFDIFIPRAYSFQ